jgi:uncharacterized protein YgiB involved in biofilm formation
MEKDHGKETTNAKAQHPSLYEQALALGDRVEGYMREHKALSGTVAAAAAVGAAALVIGTRGRSTEVAAVAEEALSVSIKESETLAHSKLAGEALNLMGGSTLRKAAQVGIVPLALLGLAGCDKPAMIGDPIVYMHVDATVYEDAASCENGGVFTKSYCDSAFDEAKRMHEQTAPKFKDKEECEDSTGVACTSAAPAEGESTGPSPVFWYRPYMYGFVTSQWNESLNNHNLMVTSTAPVYRVSGEDELVTSHGDDTGLKGPGATRMYRDTLSNASKPVSTGEEGETPETATFSRSSSSVSRVSSVSRGGFGGEASESEGGHVSGGGSRGGSSAG